MASSSPLRRKTQNRDAHRLALHQSWCRYHQEDWPHSVCLGWRRRTGSARADRKEARRHSPCGPIQSREGPLTIPSSMSKREAMLSLSPSLERRFCKKIVRLPSGCWDWKGCKLRGYGRIGTVGRQTDLAHRVSWQLYRGVIPKGLYVLHRCDHPSCANPEHLFLGTQKINIDDMKRKGRMPKGSARGHSRLTDDLVYEIRLLHPRLSYRELSEQYGVSTSTIQAIVERRTWQHVTEEYGIPQS